MEGLLSFSLELNLGIKLNFGEFKNLAPYFCILILLIPLVFFFLHLIPDIILKLAQFNEVEVIYQSFMTRLSFNKRIFCPYKILKKKETERVSVNFHE